MLVPCNFSCHVCLNASLFVSLRNARVQQCRRTALIFSFAEQLVGLRQSLVAIVVRLAWA